MYRSILLALAFSAGCSDKTESVDEAADADADTDTDSDADTDTDTDSDADTDSDTDTDPSCFDEDGGDRLPSRWVGTTSGEADDFAPTCAGGPTAGDFAYRYTAPQTGAFVFEVIGDGFDPILAVLDGCGGQELACAPAGAAEVAVLLTAGQEVVLVVDGSAEGDYQLRAKLPEDCLDGQDNDGDNEIDCLDADCSAEANCQPRCPDLVVGSFPASISGSTVGALDEDTLTGGLRSPDLSHSFTAPSDGIYGFGLVAADTDFGAILTVYDSCGGDILTGFSSIFGGEAFSLELLAGQTVIAVVDSYEERAGAYRLVIDTPTDAEICGDGFDNDFDFGWDCVDEQDCTLDATCAEDCSNGIDDDGDLRPDCQDVYCDLDPACSENCINGVDDDRDGWIDCQDVYCDSAPVCFEDCSNGIDDDGDSLLDCLDRSCEGEPICAVVCPELSLGAPPSQVAGQIDGLGDEHLGSCALFPNEASDVTVSFTAPADGDYTFDLGGTSFDSVLYVLDGCGGPEIGCTDSFLGSTDLTVTLAAGQTVIVVVDTLFMGELGTYSLQVYQ